RRGCWFTCPPEAVQGNWRDMIAARPPYFDSALSLWTPSQATQKKFLLLTQSPESPFYRRLRVGSPV
ncbi:MAG: hypothetical protein ACPIOQ_16900, partial [Promethearchaeia archaeon]